MLDIKILGPGCYNCHLLEQITKIVVDDLRTQGLALDTKITRIKHLSDMESYAIRLTPGLVINEQQVCAGRVPSKEDVDHWLRAALEQSTVS